MFGSGSNIMVAAATRETDSNFIRRIDGWVLRALNDGRRSFDQLLRILPGVYPSTVLGALHRLVAAGQLEPTAVADMVGQAQQPLYSVQRRLHPPFLPIPHPLDSDWRFTQGTARRLLHTCLELSRAGESVALLGTPTLAHEAAESHFPRHVVFIDANRAVTSALEHHPALNCVIHEDVLAVDYTTVPICRAVLADPPWYLDDFRCFLWASAQLCIVGGHVLLCIPPLGTRPGIEQERPELLEWAQAVGLDLVRVEPAAVRYASPPFEQNALRAEGLHGVATDWRCGDLAVFFRRCSESVSPPGRAGLPDEWVEERVGHASIRLRKKPDDGFESPMLASIVAGDILPSVSRRDARRFLVDVWTSGNRVFTCRGTRILQQVISATRGGRSPVEAVEAYLGRKLDLRAAQEVSLAAEQIATLIAWEHNEQARTCNN